MVFTSSNSAYMRNTVNQSIKRYWKQTGKTLTLLKPVHKASVPRFTRQNLHVYRRLSDVWRRPKGTGTNYVTSPSIGYKRPSTKRYRRSSDGLLFRVVHNVDELCAMVQRKPYEVAVFSSSIGGRKRALMLSIAKTRGIPVYI